MKYEIRNIHIDVTEDVWNEGQKPGTSSVTSYPYDIEEDDPAVLIASLMDHFNLGKDDEAVRYNEKGRIRIEYTTADKDHLTPIDKDDLEAWKAGKMKAWVVLATVQMYVVSKPKDLFIPGFAQTED
jgi:hypothetical protein